MLKHLSSWLLVSVFWAGLVFPVGQLAAADDLNREFSDSFFRLKSQDDDANLKIRQGVAKPDREIGTHVTASNVKAVDDNDPSWIGKFLQMAIIVLLGLVIYLLSRRSRNRSRY